MFLDIFPPELVRHIFEFLEKHDIISFSAISKKWRRFTHKYLVDYFGMTPTIHHLNQTKLNDLKFNNDHKEFLKLISKEFVIYGNNVQALLLPVSDCVHSLLDLNQQRKAFVHMFSNFLMKSQNISVTLRME